MKSLKLVTFFAFGAATALYAKPVVQSDIFYEISKGNKKAVRAWLKTKPDLTIKNDQGQTVLNAAVLAENHSIIQILIKAGVDVNVVDKAGKTALDCAVLADNKKIAMLLLKKQAKVTSENNRIILENMILQKKLCKSQKCGLWAQFFRFFLGALILGAVSFVLITGGGAMVCSLSSVIVGGCFGVVGAGVFLYSLTCPARSVLSSEEECKNQKFLRKNDLLLN